MYNGLMKITQPTSMAASLQITHNTCIEYSFGGGGKLPNANMTKLPNGKNLK